MDHPLDMEQEEVIASFLHDWFAFPNGSVLTNLVATALCAAPVIWRVVLWGRKMERSHKELHRKLDRIHKDNG